MNVLLPILLLLVASTACAETRITEFPDGTVLIEIDGEPRAEGDGAHAGHPVSRDVRPAREEPRELTSLLEEIGRIEEDRRLLQARTGEETPGKLRDNHAEFIRKSVELGRLRAQLKRMQPTAAE